MAVESWGVFSKQLLVVQTFVVYVVHVKIYGGTPPCPHSANA